MLVTLLDRVPVEPGWWPLEDPFAIAASAVLTQRTRWESAHGAVERLGAAGLLAPRALARADPRTVEQLVRGTGFYRQKARALQGMARRIVERHGADTARALRGPLAATRSELLEWPGVGPETADAVLLFAGGRPVFVVDAYTRRVMARFGALRAGADPPYGAVQEAWHRVAGGARRANPRGGDGQTRAGGPRANPRGRDGQTRAGGAARQAQSADPAERDAARYARLHAAIVELAKAHCRPKPVCTGCPLRRACPRHGVDPN
jgi:endonuclease III-like uncharacterized protein